MLNPTGRRTQDVLYRRNNKPNDNRGARNSIKQEENQNRFKFDKKVSFKNVEKCKVAFHDNQKTF